MNSASFLQSRLISRSFLVRRSLKRYSGLAKPYTFQQPTIYALSTPANQTSAIAIIRISGTHAKYIYNRLVDSSTVPPIIILTKMTIKMSPSWPHVSRRKIKSSISIRYQLFLFQNLASSFTLYLWVFRYLSRVKNSKPYLSF